MSERGRQHDGPILELDDVHVYYGAIHALKGVSLEVRDGRDRDADRRERRREVDDAARDQRPQPAAAGDDPLRGRGHHDCDPRTRSCKRGIAQIARGRASSSRA